MLPSTARNSCKITTAPEINQLCGYDPTEQSQGMQSLRIKYRCGDDQHIRTYELKELGPVAFGCADHSVGLALRGKPVHDTFGRFLITYLKGASIAKWAVQTVSVNRRYHVGIAAVLTG